MIRHSWMRQDRRRWAGTVITHIFRSRHWLPHIWQESRLDREWDINLGMVWPQLTSGTRALCTEQNAEASEHSDVYNRGGTEGQSPPAVNFRKRPKFNFVRKGHKGENTWTKWGMRGAATDMIRDSKRDGNAAGVHTFHTAGNSVSGLPVIRIFFRKGPRKPPQPGKKISGKALGPRRPIRGYAALRGTYIIKARLLCFYEVYKKISLSKCRDFLKVAHGSSERDFFKKFDFHLSVSDRFSSIESVYKLHFCVG